MYPTKVPEDLSDPNSDAFIYFIQPTIAVFFVCISKLILRSGFKIILTLVRNLMTSKIFNYHTNKNMTFCNKTSNEKET